MALIIAERENVEEAWLLWLPDTIRLYSKFFDKAFIVLCKLKENQGTEKSKNASLELFEFTVSFEQNFQKKACTL